MAIKLASLLLLANLSWYIFGLLFYLKCTRSSTWTINPQINQICFSSSLLLPSGFVFLFGLYMAVGKLLYSITTTARSVDLSSFNYSHGYMLLKTNEEMGEAGLAASWESQIEPISILAPGHADAHEQCGCNDWITCMYTFVLECLRTWRERCGQL